MVSFDNDTNTSILKVNKSEVAIPDKKYYRDWNNVLYFAIKDKTNEYKPHSQSEWSKYVSVDIVNSYQDFTGKTESKDTVIKYRDCTNEDFNRTSRSRKLWKDSTYWKPFLCFDNTEDVFLQGNALIYDRPRAYLQLKIRDCNGAHCETDSDKIDAFMKTAMFGLYSIYDMIDFENHDTEKPVYQRKLYTVMSDFPFYKTQKLFAVLNLVENEYTTYDRWWLPGSQSTKGGFIAP